MGTLPPNIENRIAYMKERFPDFDFDRIAPHLFLVRTGDMLWKTVGRYLAPFKLTPPAMGVLIILDSAKEPMPMHRIGRESLVSPANITGLIDTLEKSGFVRRTPSADDRRIKLIETTPKGRQAIAKVLPGFFKLIGSIYGDLTKQEALALRSGLEKVLGKLISLGAALLICALPASGAGPAGSTLTCRAAVAAAIQSHPSLQPAKTAVDRALSEQLSLLGSYDPSLAMSLNRLDAKSPPAVFFLSERTVTDSAKASLSRHFAGGTTASASAGYSREKDSVSSTFTPNPRHRSTLGLELSQPLLKGLVGFPEKSALRASEAALRAARADLAHALEGLALAVTGAYWDLWEARRSVGVHEASRDEAEEFLETTKKLQKRYEAERDDLLRAEADLLSKELELMAARERVASSEEVLAAWMMSEPGSLSGRPLPPPAPPGGPVDPAAALARALQSRPDLAARLGREEGARHALAATAGLGLPSLDLGGSLGWSGLKTEAGDSLAQTGRAGYRTWGLGLSFAYAFGARRDEASRLAAESSLLLAGEGVRELRRTIAREVALAVFRLDLAGRRVSITRELSRKQDEVLAISRSKYGQGRIASRDRLQAADAALGARRARIGAAAGYAKALAAEKASEGRLADWTGGLP